MIKSKDTVSESSLNRIRSKLKQHDAGAITAFRSDYSRSENQNRNKKLQAYLADRGYSVIMVKGSYIGHYATKGAKEVEEESFLIVDHKDSGGLKADLRKLGRLYDQDSILWIQKGYDAILIGTSRRDTAYPGFGKVDRFKGTEFGKASGAFFSRIRGRPSELILESVQVRTEASATLFECGFPRTNNGKYVMDRYAREVAALLEEVDETEECGE